MINGKRILAFIPARGGSKRLPRKNVLPLAGKPLIGWSIEAAQQSKYIDNIFVSTDDPEIASIAEQFNVKVPELRPYELASDTASTESVMIYTLEKFGQQDDIIVLLQPTSPLRTAQHIDEALEFFMEKQAFSVVSVTPCEHPPLWANTLPEDMSMGEFVRPEALHRSQDLSKYYRFNGAIYVFDIPTLIKYQEIRYTDQSYAYEMDNHVSFDIDQKIDFELAEFFMSKYTQL
ncbi:cytidylyltransferase domain-containing protein [Photobacterium damselae]|uniref:acylneuraminate cytidylyltransferase family protein n=1 Tax=Photobacterium damselae TaxID=38293 RepID=UPI0012AD36BE|nr:acylneuraminate cytidylyltransferase family protein [Photobacterium damselae]MCG9705277.1 acylneuraminate cytidylyltransferase family protein [Photobacterium damselae]